MATSREIRVQPYGATGKSITNGNEHDHVIFQLSNLDLLMPKLYVQMVEVFQLPADADKPLILSTLTDGLSLALADHPILTGTLHFDNEAKRVVVKKRPDSSVGLFVKGEGMDPPAGGGEAIHDHSLPSFSQLDRKDFPVHLLKADQVLPAPFVGTVPLPGDDLSTDGPAVCGFQLTFIEGGLILGLTVTHQVCDGQGCEAFLDSWSRHAMAATKGTAGSAAAPTIPPSTTSAFLGRETFTTSGNKSTDPMSQETWRALGDKFLTNKARSGPPAPPPADFQMPVVKSRIWHFPKSKLRELKALCSSNSSSTENCRISTYDALLAVLWRAIVRAKQPLLQPPSGAPSKVVHAVNARGGGRSSPAIPAGYIGVGVTMPQSSPALTVADVLDGTSEDPSRVAATLALLARNVRAATDSVTPEYVSDLVSFAGNAPDLRWTELDMHWVLGLDCMAFSWHGMKSYETHDFGFGTPAALRWPEPQFEGFFFVLPTRTAKKGSDDEGLEVCLGLEESCYGRFELDDELLHFAEQRGVD